MLDYHVFEAKWEYYESLRGSYFLIHIKSRRTSFKWNQHWGKKRFLGDGFILKVKERRRGENNDGERIPWTRGIDQVRYEGVPAEFIGSDLGKEMMGTSLRYENHRAVQLSYWRAVRERRFQQPGAECQPLTGQPRRREAFRATWNSIAAGEELLIQSQAQARQELDVKEACSKRLEYERLAAEEEEASRQHPPNTPMTTGFTPINPHARRE